MARPGRVGRDVLDLRLAPAVAVELRPVLTGSGDRARLIGGPTGVDVERAHAGEALDAPRQPGGDVAAIGALGVFEGALGRVDRRQLARLLLGDERPFAQFGQLFANHVPPSLSRAPTARDLPVQVPGVILHDSGVVAHESENSLPDRRNVLEPQVELRPVHLVDEGRGNRRA